MEGRSADALNVYRRLLETAATDQERAEYERQIRQSMRAIRRAAAAGYRRDGVEEISYKDAAEQFKHGAYFLRVGMVLLGLIGLLVALNFLYLEARARRGLPTPYVQAVEDTEQALAEGRYQQALQVWQRLADSVSGRDDALAEHIRDKLARVHRKYQFHVESLVLQAKLLGEEEFSVLFHQGVKDSIQLTLVADRALLAVMFDDRTTIGMVRLYANETSTKVAELLKAAAQREPVAGIGAEFTTEATKRLSDIFGGGEEEKKEKREGPAPPGRAPEPQG